MTLLLTGARIPGGCAVEIAVDGGRIVGVGERLDAPGAERRDLAGRWVVPGLWDEHVHFTQWAQTARRLDVSQASSAAEAARFVRQRVEAQPGDDVLVGFGFHDALWPDIPTRRLLDEAAGERPVVLVAGDLHCSWLNTAASRLFAPGSEDAVLREDASFAVTSRLTATDQATLDRWAADAAQAAARRGVVGIVDLEYGWNIDTWSRRLAAGQGDLRVAAGFYREDLERAVALGLRTGTPIEGTGGLLTTGPFKVISDGSLNTRTALCSHPYPDGDHGVANLTPRELIEGMRTATRAGIEPAVHAIGDEANHRALDAFQELGSGGRIEHAQLIDPDDVPRFAALGVTASVQPEHAMDDRDVADRLWAGRTADTFPFAGLLRAGARLAFGSDAPVAPLDPWVAISAAVFRSRDGREPWHPENAIPVDAALDASSRSAIVVGEPADLAVIERDPFAASADELRGMPVAATLLAGRFTHDGLG
ncbi:amidohydrolase [Leifsonia sp. NPDC080035]|uniref:Amidohydrolase n=1 Tax=Leifsonia sp. NPDC080035 TaxID=3143936 RepID=A0AAU7GAI5_9MICO